MGPPQSRRIKTLSVHRPVVYGNTARRLAEPKPQNTPAGHTHLWTIFVRGPQGEDISYYVKKVVFKLHDTYTDPIRSVETPPFELTETGWGEFDINIKVYFVDQAAEKMLSFYHRLRLHPYANLPHPMEPADAPENATAENTAESRANAQGEISAVFYDEFVFNEPNEEFFQILMQYPGNYLPANKTPECAFSRQLELEEIDRIRLARDKLEKEISELRQKLNNELEQSALNTNTPAVAE